MSLYDDAMEALNNPPLYSSAEDALVAFTAEYEALGAKYGTTGYELWLHAEHEASAWTEDLSRIHRLHQMIGMCHRLIERGKNK